jgi:hypothetical protein
VVALYDDYAEQPFCSGVLVEQNVVLSAAHCVSGEWWLPTSVVFGEDGYAAERKVSLHGCEKAPGYDDWGPVPYFDDFGYCLLEEPVEDVQPMIAALGCELERLTPGMDVTIVGFGSPDPYGEEYDGIKRYTVQKLEELFEEEHDIYLYGGDTSACYGDSGGPALVEQADGSWRVIGVASTLHPDAPWDPVCGYGAVYDMVAPHLGWLEERSCEEVTPCHDPDGTWHPTVACEAFPLDSSGSGTTWENGCATTKVSGPVSSCGPPYHAAGTGTDTDTTGTTEEPECVPAIDDTGSDPDTDTGTTDDSGGYTDEDTTEPVDPDEEDPDDPDPDDSDDSDDPDDPDEEAPFEDEEFEWKGSMCGCHSSSRNLPPLLAVLLLLRRRPR